MKTAGLLVLMAQSGLPVPASEAVLPIFDQVLADIGDNQSIQESLSTFSAHIEHIRAMLDDATRDSLVLLDELGRATDPEEGGALGVSILDTFRSTGAFTIASTHLMALKVYGASTEGVQNASMGFDELTLQPTYVLRLGAPGKSAGLDIATRLGMPAYMIEKARSVSRTRNATSLVSSANCTISSTAPTSPNRNSAFVYSPSPNASRTSPRNGNNASAPNCAKWNSVAKPPSLTSKRKPARQFRK